ncbi:hypothetical protein [Salmonirosea aquatica]
MQLIDFVGQNGTPSTAEYLDITRISLAQQVDYVFEKLNVSP